MFSFIRNLLGSNADLKEMLAEGALLLDVRTPSEFKQMSIPSSVNISVQQLPKRLGELDKNQGIIVFCASGMRSASAKRLLKAKGFNNVQNGGGIQNVFNKLS